MKHFWTDSEPCRVIAQGRARQELDGVVDLCIAGKPVAVAVDGMIDGQVGWVPLIWKDEQAETLFGTPIELEPRDTLDGA